MSRVRRTLASLGLWSAFLFAVAAWFLWPRADASAGSALRVVAFDASASVVRRRPDWSGWLRQSLLETARRAEREGERVLLVRYAEAADVLFEGDPTAFTDALLGRGAAPLSFAVEPGADEASRIDAALAVARARAELGGPVGLTVLSDGGYDGADPSPALEALRARGVAVTWRDPPPATRPDAGLAALRLPPRVEPGAPLVADVEWFCAPGGTDRELVIELELVHGSARRTATSGPIRVAAGGLARGVAAVPLGAALPGRSEVAARARVVGAVDPVPENDHAAAAVATGGALVGAVVAPVDRLEQARDFFGEPAGVQLWFTGPDELATRLDELDLLVTLDVELDLLPVAALARFVETGGGWLHAGGWAQLARGPASLEPLLPLIPDPGGGRERDVLFLVDGSGSMEGEPFEAVRAALLELGRLAPPADELQLRFFTVGPLALHVVRGRGEAADATRASLSRRLDLRVPSGPTQILSSVEAVARERATAEVPTLLFLLTDGRESQDALRTPERIAAWRELLESARVELVVVAVGSDADRAFLQTLVRDGETLWLADELARLEDIFRREVNRERVREGDLPVRWAASAGDEWTREIFGADREALPGVARYVRSRPRPDAHTLWTSEEAEPVLAVRREGAGRTAAWASSIDGGWSPARSGSELAPLLRWLGRRERRASAAVRYAGGQLSLEWGGEDLPWELDASLELDGDSHPVRWLPASGPGGLLHDHARVARLDGGLRRRLEDRRRGHLAGLPGRAPLPIRFGPATEHDPGAPRARVEGPARGEPASRRSARTRPLGLVLTGAAGVLLLGWGWARSTHPG